MLDAATSLAVEPGPAGLTVEAVVQRSGIAGRDDSLTLGSHDPLETSDPLAHASAPGRRVRRQVRSDVTDRLVDALTEVVGARHVLTDPDLIRAYEQDWTGRFRGSARCVVRPGDTGQVAGVLRTTADAGGHVVVQGGNTGLVGGATPRDGDVVLSLGRLDELGPVDVAARTVEVGAGATLAAVQTHAAQHDLRVGVDLAARDSATIGGMVATDAGGTRVLAFGAMRAQVAGLEAVLADGSVLTSWLGGVVKDTAGYDLPALLVGSEGTLAVLTRILLRLHPVPPQRVVALLGFDEVADAARAAVGVRDHLDPDGDGRLEACELVLAAGIDLVREVAGLPAPFPQPAAAALLVEVTGRAPPTGLAATLAPLAELADQAVVAVDEPDARRLWAYREHHTEAVATLGVPHKLDVAVPPGALVELLDRVRATVGDVAPDAQVHVWGHAADANLHVNVVGPDADERRSDRAVLELVGALGGSVSAEHGIGRAKLDALSLTRDDGSIAAMRAVRAALDPRGVLNPGVGIPGGTE